MTTSPGKPESLPAVNWRVTATTVICTSTGAEVTVMVYKDGSIKCTGQAASVSKKKKTECAGPDCDQNKQYRDKLFGEGK